jgi:spore germination protein GerM
VPPWYHQFLIRAEVLQTDGSIVADASYRNGFVGRSFGFDVYMSNNLSTGVDTANAMSHYLLAGTQRAMSFAEQVVKVEAYRPENSFADAVKGLHVYGAKVIDPNALVRINTAASAT